LKIPYARQWISEEDKEKVLEVLNSDYLTTGPFVEQFERAFAEYVGSKYAIAVSNGTAALHLAAQAMDIDRDSEVITTPISFAATSNCVLYNSGRPIFADVTSRGLVNPQEIKKRVKEETAGLIPVHYMGLPCDMDDIHRIANENDLFIIEDASHALGARYRNTKIGDCEYSDMATFSFHPVKHITTGEGGIITTNSESLNELLRNLRTHGITKNESKFKTHHREPWYQEMHHLGFNYRMTDIQAALGLSQLSRINEFVSKRREIAEKYSNFFEEFEDEVEIIHERDHEFHSYHLYVIKLKDARKRLDLYRHLSKRNIYTQVHYIPIYRHPYYRELGYKDNLPKAEEFYARILSLPMYPAMTAKEIQHVLDAIRDFFR
jgi:UDP-4-amino-4,6-dideoxy-N-acetyl-beta-L-altrosamine transaminase